MSKVAVLAVSLGSSVVAGVTSATLSYGPSQQFLDECFKTTLRTETFSLRAGRLCFFRSLLQPGLSLSASSQASKTTQVPLVPSGIEGYIPHWLGLKPAVRRTSDAVPSSLCSTVNGAAGHNRGGVVERRLFARTQSRTVDRTFLLVLLIRVQGVYFKPRALVIVGSRHHPQCKTCTHVSCKQISILTLNSNTSFGGNLTNVAALEYFTLTVFSFVFVEICFSCLAWVHRTLHVGGSF